MSRRRRLLLLGAAGRDFHDFNVRFRNDPASEVVAFTAAQIPFIAGRRYPAALAGPHYPEGIPILAEDALPGLLADGDIDEVVLCYSDLAHEQVMHLASRAIAGGASFRLPGPRETELPTRRPVLAVLAARTGAGKSTVSRLAFRGLSAAGWRVVVVRHPMPYGELSARVERYASAAEVREAALSVEAMEEYQQHVDNGAVVFAGVDYARVRDAAEAEADLLLWDGGNNDRAFFRPACTLTVLDPTRPGQEDRYFPGEVNVRSADVLVLNKANVATPAALAECRRRARALNAGATLLCLDSLAIAEAPGLIEGRRVLVVEDGPSLTHGGMAEGAGAAAARALGCVLVDPRPHALGSIAETLAACPHIGPVLPALGYSAAQLRELEATLARVPCEAVVLATPAPLERLVSITRPVSRVRFEAREHEPGRLLELLGARLAQARGG